MWTCAGVVLLAACALAITRDQFYPYGPTFDVQLPRGNNVASPELPLNVPILFYGEQYDTIFVNNFGVLSFRSEISSFINAEFPLPYASIAAFYTNIDTTEKGTVYYRETNDTRVLVKASETIQENFLEYYDFQPTSIFVATWVDVSYSGYNDRSNTFQVAVISNGTESFAELLYPERDIQWIQTHTHDNSLPDAKAQVGFVAEDGRLLSLRGSGSHQIRNIVTWSNIQEPGKYLFRIGNIQPEENIAEPDNYNQYDIENQEESKTCAQSGPTVCHVEARCLDYLEGMCCECKEGYYGNGKTCIKNDVPLRVHGKLSGEINGVTIDDINIQAYVVVDEGRSYTALSQSSVSIGSSLQSLNILGGVIGWLFAKPFSNAKNGYQLTGGIFNHTADIFFPGTGDRVTIKQEFSGQDVFDQITLEADIRGTVPRLEPDERLDIDDYSEDFTAVGIGTIRSQSTRTFINKKTQTKIEQTITQTITYNTCRYASISDEDNIPYVLEVSKNYLGYEIKDNLLRYGMRNKIFPIGHENPCAKGRTTCGLNSVCIIEGASYRCVCNTGYENVYLSKGESCIDIDECQTGTHNCDVNADCSNYDGAFGCRCKAGYDGNGLSCHRRPSGCSRMTCDHNAQCVDNYEYDVGTCICNPGFTGNGQQCSPIKEITCYESYNCSPHATCEFSPSADSFVCQCNAGYIGDGYNCVLDIYSTTTTESYDSEYDDKFVLPTCNDYDNRCTCPSGYNYYEDEHRNKLCQKKTEERIYNGTGIACENDYHCPPNAKCLYSEASGFYECQCPPGYDGDGFECIEKTSQLRTVSCDVCGKNAHCVNSSSDERMCVCDFGYHGDGFICRPNLSCINNTDCEYNAECVYEANSGVYVCQCVEGYKKDQNDACILDEHLCNGGVCAEHASCIWDSTLQIDYCQCDEGYEGLGVESCIEVGRTCDVTNDCGNDAVCKRTEHGYGCVCNEGFTGDGHMCNPTCIIRPNICNIYASCVFQNSEYTCKCNDGYLGDGNQCQALPRRPGNFLITSDGMFLYRVPFEFNFKDFALPINSGIGQIAVGMDVDCERGRVYWGDLESHSIKTSAYDGSSFNQFLTTNIDAPEGIAVDWVSRNIFWTDSKKLTIEVANLETKVRKVLFSREGMKNLRGITVHPLRGKIFWSDWNRRGPKIEWANMDGSDRQIFLGSPDVMLPNSLAIDWSTDQLCFADAGLHKIQCVNIDTKQIETKAENCKYPFGLALTDNKIYWTDWKTIKIEYLDRRTLSRGTLPSSGGKLYGITVAHDVCPAGIENVCKYRNGNCDREQICLPNGRGGRSCLT